jgi:hypothetical protein
VETFRKKCGKLSTGWKNRLTDTIASNTM